MDEIFADICVGLVTIAIVLAIACGVLFLVDSAEKSHNKELWNDGHCSCGGAWEYEQAVGHRYNTSYIYVCPECNKRIEITEMR